MFIIKNMESISRLWVIMFYVRVCSLYRCCKVRLVCPMYERLQVLQVSLYMPLVSCSVLCWYGMYCSNCCMVFVVLYVIYRFVCLNRLVIVRMGINKQSVLLPCVSRWNVYILQKMIHGPSNVQFITAQQAEIIHIYENIKLKLYKCTAAIWYNKTCKLRHLTPRHIHITVNGNNPQCRKTKSAAIQFRLQQEIKFLYVKKQHLNGRLYRLHLECASQWDVHWYNIQQMVDHNLHRKMELHYNRLNKKLDQLHQQSRPKQRTTDRTRKPGHQFYHRVENLTNIKFMAEEVKILNYGPQYSMEKPTLSYLPTLVTETKKAIRLLDIKLQDPYRFLAAQKLKQIIN